MSSKRIYIITEAVAAGFLQLGVFFIGAAVIQFSFGSPELPGDYGSILGVAFLGVSLFVLGASLKKCS